MATVRKAQKKAFSEPRPCLWTRKEYYRMGEMGLFQRKRVELIEGEIIEMSPIQSSHATSVTLCDEALREVFHKGWVVRVQNPLSLGENSDPEPDLAVVAGKTRDFTDAHPDTAALVIEVADSSLAYDRKNKASLYAKAGIADYWIVNLSSRQVEVHRRPVKAPEAPYGYAYAENLIFNAGDAVKPLAKPKSIIAVADLLP
ncbi:MAG: Uma2 family endonuclease [Blastocatellia bacterium]|nr:Uma2 family endonuclease [Blastocatellia bacterium]